MMFLRRIMKRILLGIINNIHDHLTSSAKLHWLKCEGGLCAECLMEYPATQPPMFTIPGKCKITILAVPGSTWAPVTRGVESCTHGSRVAMYGRSEYNCDRFSSNSTATEREFNTTTSVSKSRMYIIPPMYGQGRSFRLWTALTILCLPFCICQPGLLSVDREGTSQDWKRSRTRRKRISPPLDAIVDNPSNYIHDHKCKWN